MFKLGSQVTFPESADWVSYWNTSETYKAGDTVKFSNISLYKYTVFFRQGTGYPHSHEHACSHACTHIYTHTHVESACTLIILFKSLPRCYNEFVEELFHNYMIKKFTQHLPMFIGTIHL